MSIYVILPTDIYAIVAHGQLLANHNSFKSNVSKLYMKDKNNSSNEFVITDYKRELVIARIDAQVPSNFRLSMGLHSCLSKEDLIKHIKSGDEIGKNIIDSHIRFLKAVAKGEVTKAITSF